MYYDGKKVTSYLLSPEAKGQTKYVSDDIASFIKYSCSYCEDPFYLVDLYSHEAGGAIQREYLKHKDTGSLAVKRSSIYEVLH
jgi:hypothetical protein